MAYNLEIIREDRREFLQRAASLCGLTLCSSALAGLLASCETDTVKSTGSTATLLIDNEEALKEIGGGVKKTFGSNNGGRPVIIVRTAADKFVAFSSVCPHAGCEVSAPESAGDELVCNQPGCGHGSVFAPTTGAVEVGPATSPLKSFATTYSVNTEGKGELVITF